MLNIMLRPLTADLKKTTDRSHLIRREVVQQLTDIVVILTLPVVAGPGYAVLPLARVVCHQAFVHGLHHFQWLSSRKLQCALHKFRVSGEG